MVLKADDAYVGLGSILRGSRMLMLIPARLGFGIKIATAELKANLTK